MTQPTRQPVPDPEERPKAYQDPDVLEDLFVGRGWRRHDIADHFEIDILEVRKWLREHGIEREVKRSHAPNNGLARELFERGLAEVTQPERPP